MNNVQRTAAQRTVDSSHAHDSVPAVSSRLVAGDHHGRLLGLCVPARLHHVYIMRVVLSPACVTPTFNARAGMSYHTIIRVEHEIFRAL